jgi:hypothetical protein
MGTYLVIVNNFRRNLNHKIVFVFSFLFPFILCLAAGWVNQLDRPVIRVGVISEENVSRGVIAKLLNISEFTYMKAMKESSNSDLITGKYQIILDYSPSGSRCIPLIYSVQNLKKITGEKETLTKTERAVSYLMTLFLITAVVQGSGVIKDKQTGTLERYCYSMKRKKSYYMGFFLHNLIITFIQGTAAMLIMRGIDKEWGLSAGKSILTAAVIALVSVIFASVICVVSKKDMNANLTASSLSVVLSLLGGTFVAVENMPKLFQVMSVISPIRWIIELIRWI